MSDRRRELSRVHAMRGELQMPDDEYRDLIAGMFGGIRSAAELDDAQRGALIKHLAKLQRAHGLQSERNWRAPMVRKIAALWHALADAGVVHDRSEPAMLAWCARTTGVARVEWLKSVDLRKCIEALKKWCARTGVETL